MTHTGAPVESAHPRRCGEHRHDPYRCAGRVGSSPQVRGTRTSIIPESKPRGLIPAGAGNTLGASMRHYAQTAHPRRCGEHWIRLLPRGWRRGSSPQVRGTLGAMRSPLAAGRLIPAGAGNTIAIALELYGYPAHPRRCGEHGGWCGG